MRVAVWVAVVYLKVGEETLQKNLYVLFCQIPNKKFEGLKVADWKGEMREESVCLFCCVYGYWFEGEGPSIKYICKMLACLTLSLLVRFSRNLPVLHNHIIGQIRNPTQCRRHLWMGPKGRERDGAKVFSFSAPVDPTRRLMAVSCFAVRYLEEEDEKWKG